ncbi:MAG: DUF3800 domain-containing protein [Cetobacterium sp.]|uniref:DUF3800 domain-containing protein n=1 Tax=Cetobacterium sp. TaxID=2071632 RepID=UPI003F358FDC
MNYIYCDESSYLKNDGSDVMVLGGIICPRYKKKYLNEEINKIKIKYGLTKDKELKWTKVSNKYENLYKDVIDFLMKEDKIKFRVVLVTGKKELKYDEFNQDHNIWYNKLYYFLLSKNISTEKVKHIFVDRKDTLGGQRTASLKAFLKERKNIKDKYFDIYQINSSESNIMQGLDIFIGMVAYINKDEIKLTNNGKSNLIKYFLEKYNVDLTKKSSFKMKKIKIYKVNLNKGVSHG